MPNWSIHTYIISKLGKNYRGDWLQESLTILTIAYALSNFSSCCYPPCHMQWLKNCLSAMVDTKSAIDNQFDDFSLEKRYAAFSPTLQNFKFVYVVGCHASHPSLRILFCWQGDSNPRKKAWVCLYLLIKKNLKFIIKK